MSMGSGGYGVQYAGEYTLKKLQLISPDFTKSIDLIFKTRNKEISIIGKKIKKEL